MVGGGGRVVLSRYCEVNGFVTTATDGLQIAKPGLTRVDLACNRNVDHRRKVCQLMAGARNNNVCVCDETVIWWINGNE